MGGEKIKSQRERENNKTEITHLECVYGPRPSVAQLTSL